MDEILKELIRSTQERGPLNKQFYSNLSITKPIHDHVEIHQRLEDAITYLQSRFKSGQGFQSNLYTSRNCAIESTRVDSFFKIPAFTGEVLTSVLVLDLLFNHVENERFILPSFQEIICNFPPEILDELHDFIVPSCGISTFNLFKQFQQATTPTPSPPPNLHNNLLCREDFDSGNDSPTSFQTQEGSSENVTCLVDNIPDDINTSMLALYVLLHQGILQTKPVESVLQWIISNVLNYEEGNVNQEVAEKSEILQEEHKSLSVTSFKFPVFIHGHPKNLAFDAVGVANLLSLLYHLDFSHELLLNAAEEFLVKTLNDTLTSLDVMCSGGIPSTSSLNSLAASEKVESVNSLGNTRDMISSPTDDEEEKQCNGEANQHQPEYILQHHSPDSLLYFLSRALANTNNTNSNCRRPYIRQMKSLLQDLLDARLGTTMNTCDLAMRILAGVYLGVVEVQNNAANLNSTINMPNERHCSSPRSSSSCSTAKSLRMNNLLQKEFELLVSLQNDIDGSWPADSIVQMGMNGNQTNDCNNRNNESISVENNVFPADGTMNCAEYTDDDIIAYLGGKELATIFAVKAISVFMSWKKGAFVSDTGDFWDSGKPENTDVFGADAELHQLY